MKTWGKSLKQKVTAGKPPWLIAFALIVMMLVSVLQIILTLEMVIEVL